MTWGAYVYGDLNWPMPDMGLVAVWRAMPIDASQWSDWDGFVEDVNAGTIGGLVDRVTGDAPFKLELDENGVRLRAFIDQLDAQWWQRLAIAWRAAADLGASGEFVWVPGDACPIEVAYHAVIEDYGSTWEKRTASAIEHQAGRQEIEAMVLAAPQPIVVEAAPIEAKAKKAKPAAKKKAAKKSGKKH